MENSISRRIIPTNKIINKTEGAYAIPIRLATVSMPERQNEKTMKTTDTKSQINEYSVFNFFRRTRLRTTINIDKLAMIDMI